jgi:MFS family permease
VVVAVVSFFVAIGFGVIGPALPLLAAHFGVGAALAGLAISAFAAFRFLSAMAGGRLVRAFGERAIMTAGLLLQAVTSILAGLAPNFALLITFRAIGGIGSASFTVASIALIIRIAPEQQRGRAMGIYQGGFILGSIAGPGLGGVLAGISLRLPLVVYGLFLLLAAVFSRTMLRIRDAPRDEPQRSEQIAEATLAEPAIPGEALADAALAHLAHPAQPAEHDAGPTAIEQLRTALRSRPYLAALLANLGVGWVFYGMRNALLPLYISQRLGQSASWTGLAFLLSALAQAVCLLRAGRITDSWGRKPALLLGAGVSILSVAAFTLPLSPDVFLVPMLTMGVGGALLATAPGALVGDAAPGRGEAIIALFSMVSDLGGITGPLVSGWLADRFSFAAAFWVGCAILASGFVLTLTIGRGSPRPAAAAAAPTRPAASRRRARLPRPGTPPARRSKA